MPPLSLRAGHAESHFTMSESGTLMIQGYFKSVLDFTTGERKRVKCTGESDTLEKSTSHPMHRTFTREYHTELAYKWTAQRGRTTRMLPRGTPHGRRDVPATRDGSLR
jgi:hypothetical protein